MGVNDPVSGQFDFLALLTSVRKNLVLVVACGGAGLLLAAGLVAWMGPRHVTQWTVRIAKTETKPVDPSAVAKIFRLALGRDDAEQAIKSVAALVAGPDSALAGKLATELNLNNARYADDPKNAPFRLVSNGAGQDMSLVMISSFPLSPSQIDNVGQTLLDQVVKGFNSGGGSREDAGNWEQVRRQLAEVHGKVGVLESELFAKMRGAAIEAPAQSALIAIQDPDMLVRPAAVLGVLRHHKKLSEGDSGVYLDRIVDLAKGVEALRFRLRQTNDGPVIAIPALSVTGVALSRWMWQRPAAILCLGLLVGAWVGVLVGLMRSRVRH
jgi:hypothetical protein